MNSPTITAHAACVFSSPAPRRLCHFQWDFHRCFVELFSLVLSRFGVEEVSAWILQSAALLCRVAALRRVVRLDGGVKVPEELLGIQAARL